MSATSIIYQGGLLRCCIQSITEDTEPETEGRTLPCRFHEDSTEPVAEFRDGAWRWVGSTRESNDVLPGFRP